MLDDHGPEPEDRVERDDVLRAVRQHQRHPVTGLDAESTQPFRCPGDLVAELGVGGRLPKNSVATQSGASATERS